MTSVRRLAGMRARRAHLGWLMAAGLAVGGCAVTPAASAPHPESSLVASSPAANAEATGVYLDFGTCDPDRLHQLAGTTQVYFFYQADCPKCAAADATLLAKGVPAGLTVFKVDLPSMPDLARKYGVTKPNTFVQVNGAGAKVKSWTGSVDGAEIETHIK